MSIIDAVKRAVTNQDNGDSINELPKSELSSILDKNSAKIEDSIHVISELMHYSETERVRLDAAGKVLELHGVTKTDSHVDNRILVVVQAPEDGNSEERLNALINPRRLSPVNNETLEIN